MPFVAGFFFFFASPELDGANVVAVFFTNLFKSRSKLLVLLVFAAVVVVVVASSSSPSFVARSFTRARRFKAGRRRPSFGGKRDRFLPDNKNDDDDDDDDDDDVVVLLLGVEKERDDDVDANTALGSDGRHPLSATTFIVVLVLVFSSSGALCVYIYSEEYPHCFSRYLFFLVQKTNKKEGRPLSLSR